MAGRDKLSDNSSPLLGLPFDGTTWWNGDLCTQKHNWKWMLGRLWINENIGSWDGYVLASYMDESLISVMKKEEKT